MEDKFFENHKSLLGNQDKSMAQQIRQIEFQDGSQYVGKILNGYPHGLGHMIFPDGTVYDGHFQFGVMHGDGHIRSPGGQEYIGRFSNGVKHGYGSLKLTASGPWVSIRYENDIIFENEEIQLARRDIKMEKSTEHKRGKVTMSSGLGSVSTEEAEQVYLEYSQIQTQTPYNSNLAGKKTSEPSTPNQQSGGLLLRSPESVLARKSAYFEQKNGSSEILGPQNTILRENLGIIQLERNIDSVDIFKLEWERNSLSGEFPAQEETSVKSNRTQKSTVEITCQQPANQDAESNIFKNKYSASFLEIYLQSHSKGSILDRFIS